MPKHTPSPVRLPRNAAWGLCAFAAVMAAGMWIAGGEGLRADLLVFPDVPEGSEGAEDIAYVRARGIVRGYPDGTYRPDARITRAEFTKMMVLSRYPDTLVAQGAAAQDRAFPDVPEDAWFFPFVAFSRRQGIVAGYADGTFGPDKNITAAESVKVFANAFSLEPAFPVDEDPWYLRYAVAAKPYLPASLDDPAEPVNRRQLAQMLAAVLRRKPELAAAGGGGHAAAQAPAGGSAASDPYGWTPQGAFPQSQGSAGGVAQVSSRASSAGAQASSSQASSGAVPASSAQSYGTQQSSLPRLSSAQGQSSAAPQASSAAQAPSSAARQSSSAGQQSSFFLQIFSSSRAQQSSAPGFPSSASPAQSSAAQSSSLASLCGYYAPRTDMAVSNDASMVLFTKGQYETVLFNRATGEQRGLRDRGLAPTPTLSHLRHVRMAADGKSAVMSAVYGFAPRRGYLPGMAMYDWNADAFSFVHGRGDPALSADGRYMVWHGGDGFSVVGQARGEAPVLQERGAHGTPAGVSANGRFVTYLIQTIRQAVPGNPSYGMVTTYVQRVKDRSTTVYRDVPVTYVQERFISDDGQWLADAARFPQYDDASGATQLESAVPPAIFHVPTGQRTVLRPAGHDGKTIAVHGMSPDGTVLLLSARDPSTSSVAYLLYRHTTGQVSVLRSGVRSLPRAAMSADGNTVVVLAGDEPALYLYRADGSLLAREPIDCYAGAQEPAVQTYAALVRGLTEFQPEGDPPAPNPVFTTTDQLPPVACTADILRTDSLTYRLSADGQVLAYVGQKDLSGLGLDHGSYATYVYDRRTLATEKLYGHLLAVSRNGRFVTLARQADTVVHDRQARTTTVLFPKRARWAEISDDGRFIAFGFVLDFGLLDRQGGHAVAGMSGTGSTHVGPLLNADGTFLIHQAKNHTSGFETIWRLERTSGGTKQLVNKDAAGNVLPNGSAANIGMTGDGRFVFYDRFLCDRTKASCSTFQKFNAQGELLYTYNPKTLTDDGRFFLQGLSLSSMDDLDPRHATPLLPAAVTTPFGTVSRTPYTVNISTDGSTVVYGETQQVQRGGETVDVPVIRLFDRTSSLLYAVHPDPACR